MKKNLTIKNNLYIKILVWAYDRHELGFTEKEIFDEFKLSKDQINCYVKLFRSSYNVGDNLIGHIKNREEGDLYSLTALGISAAVDYIGLEEARKSGKRAERIALFSIFIGVTVGVAQIAISIIQYTGLNNNTVLSLINFCR
ncbi:MAG: hypothetical protein Q7U04_12605 [Bacteriovorax sp.]|nr:hypothetical protein [Bacteriovorax sp.]